jgi:hypothetical protein
MSKDQLYRTVDPAVRRLSDRFFEADTPTHLADVYAELGQVDAARASLRQALAVLAELDHRDAERVAAKLREIEGQRVAG